MFQCVTTSMSMSNTPKFLLGQGHRETRIISSSLLTVYSGILGRWKGDGEGLVTDEGVCPSISPSCSGDGVQSWKLAAKSELVVDVPGVLLWPWRLIAFVS